MKNILSVVLLLFSVICFAHSPEPLSNQLHFNDVVITAPTTTIKVVLNSTQNVVSIEIQKVSDKTTYTSAVEENITDVGFSKRKRLYKKLYTSYVFIQNSKYHISIGAKDYCRNSERV